MSIKKHKLYNKKVDFMVREDREGKLIAYAHKSKKDEVVKLGETVKHLSTTVCCEAEAFGEKFLIYI